MGLWLMRRAQDRRLMSAFKMSPETVVTYLLHLEEHYNCHTPYHNNVHAADVTQSAYVLLSVAALQVTQNPPSARCCPLVGHASAYVLLSVAALQV